MGSLLEIPILATVWFVALFWDTACSLLLEVATFHLDPVLQSKLRMFPTSFVAVFMMNFGLSKGWRFAKVILVAVVAGIVAVLPDSLSTLPGHNWIVLTLILCLKLGLFVLLVKGAIMLRRVIAEKQK